MRSPRLALAGAVGGLFALTALTAGPALADPDPVPAPPSATAHSSVITHQNAGLLGGLTGNLLGGATTTIVRDSATASTGSVIVDGARFRHVGDRFVPVGVFPAPSELTYRVVGGAPCLWHDGAWVTVSSLPNYQIVDGVPCQHVGARWIPLTGYAVTPTETVIDGTPCQFTTGAGYTTGVWVPVAPAPVTISAPPSCGCNSTAPVGLPVGLPIGWPVGLPHPIGFPHPWHPAPAPASAPVPQVPVGSVDAGR